MVVNCENDQLIITTQKLKDEDKTIKESKEKTKKKTNINIEELKDNTDIKEKIKKKPIHKSLKIAVWNKYIGEDIGKTKCLCCEITEITQLKFHCGHIVAECEGGETNITNLMPICESCNKSMNKMNLYEFKKLITENKKETKNENMEIKIKLDELIDRLKKYNINYYQNKLYYKTEDYNIISNTFDKFFIKNIQQVNEILYNSYNVSRTYIIYTHKKCDCNIKISPDGNIYYQQVQNFIKHIECLKNDDEYTDFIKN